MRYYRIRDDIGNVHLTVESDPGKLVSLTALNDEVRGFDDLMKVSYVGGQSIDDVARNVLAGGDGPVFDLDSVVESSKAGPGGARVIRPLDPDEIWAGGIGNYPVPDEAVSAMPDFTRTAYEADRPPVMYKGGPTRLAGPYDDIGVRSDTTSVAEGELVLVLYKGSIVAYSTGNEVAGGLMGQTIWWMVPSKVFTGCASLGPCVVTPESMPDPTGRDMELTITRNGGEAGSSTNTTDHRRPPEEIVKWVTAHDTPPDVVIIYTGGCVADGPLEDGDVVRISLDGVGAVENRVTVV